MTRRPRRDPRCRFQTLERRVLLAGDVAEVAWRADVNSDGRIDTQDVRMVIDALPFDASATPSMDVGRLDVNGDGRVTASDALRVINQLNRLDAFIAAEGQVALAGAAGPDISVLDAQVVEGNAGSVQLVFTVELSEAASDVTTVDVAVSNHVGAPHPAGALLVQRISSGLTKPLFVTAAPGKPDSLFVVEQGGVIKVLDLQTNTLGAQPFLQVTDLISGGERGLLGLAFHPQYASNRRFYIYMTEVDGSSLVREYQATTDGMTADPLSARRILGFAQPFSNHNGGWIAFGPDGYLYIASGDGGSGNDPQNNAQDITDNWLGKMLRIDVDGDSFQNEANRNYAIPASNPFVGRTGDDEIWAYGLRNPWRNSFDRATGDLYIADVGQGVWEEINVQPGDSPGGENYGWRPREGLVPTPSVGGDKPPGAIDPIHVYRHGTGLDEGFSVTGGYVYRGPIRELNGNYFFADYVRSRVWSLRFNGDTPAQFNGTNYGDYMQWTSLLRPDVGTIRDIASFGEDAAGNLYIVDLGGEIFRLTGGGDYLPSSVRVTFNPGEKTKSFVVDVLGDRLPEANESVLVSLSNPVNGTILRGQAIGTIQNDDPPRVESVVVNQGETQRSIVDRVAITFDSIVALQETNGPAFAFRNRESLANVEYVKQVSVVDNKSVVTFQFLPGPSVLARGSSTPTLDDGSYELTIMGSRIHVEGIALDGDQDGTPGGDYRFVDTFFRKFGDSNAGGFVDLLDFAQFRGSFGTSEGTPAYQRGFDVDGNGVIGLSDFAEFRRNFGT